MTTWYFDSSGLTKRYTTETGTAWVKGCTDPMSGDSVCVSTITRVEVTAALARKRRAGNLSVAQLSSAIALLNRHFEAEYKASAVTDTIVAKAAELTTRHPLRAYDAVQLATALAVDQAIQAADLGSLVFVASDAQLLAAAVAEGLATKDPNQPGA